MEDSKDLIPQAIDGVSHFELELRTGDLDDLRIVSAAKVYLREVLYPLLKRVHESQDPVVEAAYRAHRVAVAARAALLAPLLQAEERLKKALGAREKALRLREESARTAVSFDDLTPQPVLEVVSLAEYGVSTKSRFSWRVRDLEQVRRAYLVPDKVAINKAVTKHGKNAEGIVGGIAVTEEDPRVTVRRGKE